MEPISVVLRGSGLVVVRADGAYRDLIGDVDPIGKPLVELLPELDGTESIELPRRVMRDGSAVTGRLIRSRLRPGLIAVLSCWSWAEDGLPDYVGVELSYLRASDLARPGSRPATREAARPARPAAA
jgi:hypothetical protein